MERDEVMSSEYLKRVFVRDRSLPITLLDNPYFEQRLLLLDQQFGCESAFKVFCKELNDFKTESDYIAYRDHLEQTVLGDLKERITKSHFDTAYFRNSPSEEEIELTERYAKRYTYSEKYINKVQILIRFKDDLFSPMYLFSPEIFDNQMDWRSYMSKFSRYEHLCNSNDLEESLLTSFTGIRLRQWQTTCFIRLLIHLLKMMPSIADQIVSLGDNGIVIIPEVGQIIERGELLDAISSEPSGIGNYVATEVFWLKELEGIGLMKNVYGFGGNKNRVEFKHVDPDILPQVITYYNKEIMLPDHLVFKRDGRLAKFLEPIKNPFK